MNYYTYVLVSLRNYDIYIGSTANINNRFQKHNNGQVKSTKGYRPWKLLEYHESASRSEAMNQEKFLKNHR